MPSANAVVTSVGNTQPSTFSAVLKPRPAGVSSPAITLAAESRRISSRVSAPSAPRNAAPISSAERPPSGASERRIMGPNRPPLCPMAR